MLVVTGILVVVAVVVLYLLRSALLPFILGGIMAYALHPITRALESWMPWRGRWPALSRTGAILLIYLAALAAIAGALLIIIPPATRETQEFIQAVPGLFAKARAAVEGWNREYASRIPEDVRKNFEGALANAGKFLVGQIQATITRSITTVTRVLNLIIGLAIVPIFLYYVLKDREALAAGLSASFPSGIQPHALNILAIVNRVLGAYVRAQLFLALLVGLMVFLGLFFLGIKFSVLLGIIAGLFELVPIIGPWLGAIPGILVTLATSPGDTLWVVLLYLGVQLLENILLVPRVQGHALKLHPVMIMVIIVVGHQWAGLWGIIISPPLAAIAVEVVKYFRREWDREMLPPGTGPATEQLAQTGYVDSQHEDS
jgi:predicted PurR-regulated permease PerM